MDDYDENEYHRAKKRALYLLGAKDYSSGELKKKLLNNYCEETCVQVVADMKDFGYLDDERYAKKLAAYLICSKKHGKQKAAFEMRSKGVPRDLIEQCLEQYGKDDIRAEITAYIRKKYSEKLSTPDDVRRTIAALARRGYGYDDIKAALEAVRADMDEIADKEFG